MKVVFYSRFSYAIECVILKPAKENHSVGDASKGGLGTFEFFP